MYPLAQLVFFLAGGGELFPLGDLTKNPSASHQRKFLGKKWVKLRPDWEDHFLAIFRQ
jgi:hypothetical protein